MSRPYPCATYLKQSDTREATRGHLPLHHFGGDGGLAEKRKHKPLWLRAADNPFVAPSDR